jgi:hypothetical protein
MRLPVSYLQPRTALRRHLAHRAGTWDDEGEREPPGNGEEREHRMAADERSHLYAWTSPREGECLGWRAFPRAFPRVSSSWWLATAHADGSAQKSRTSQ